MSYDKTKNMKIADKAQQVIHIFCFKSDRRFVLCRAGKGTLRTLDV